MAGNLTYLITGSNRGIGRQIVADLLLRPATTVVATARDSDSSTSRSLGTLPTAAGSRLVVVPLDGSREDTGHETLRQRLKNKDIGRLDVVVANAGIADIGFVLQTEATEARECFEVNSLGVLRLFQACWPLMEQSDPTSGGNKFVLITSFVGSIGGLGLKEPMAKFNLLPVAEFGWTAYGMSKASANWLARKISFEFRDKGLLVGVINPGCVNTDMTQRLANKAGVEPLCMPVEHSSRCVLEQVDRLCPDTSGKFLNFDGEEIPW
ncbi:hypothetical protein CDD80_2563 [Ophiocordyceps camponoti-rufipedis]|uniref:Ketoreductase (KR) domain-containing protein n=1 Tax=Ophiocordyceps camponoti-rufipedis TaxID=2004952 RepID=A0A2C5ZKA8_9HYPO|nr:hypothetical protein CDD80_2563 [Ophiocordyceps camponoti-rufipedis]